MTGRSSAHFHRIEWEGLQDTWEVEDLAKTPMLPPGSKRIELRRDEQYRIEAKILGTREGAFGDLLPDLGETGQIIPDYRIEGSSHHGSFSYDLDHCVVGTGLHEGDGPRGRSQDVPRAQDRVARSRAQGVADRVVPQRARWGPALPAIGGAGVQRDVP